VYADTALTLVLLASNDIALPLDGISESACGLSPLVEPLARLLNNGSSVPCGSCAGCKGTNENQITVSTNAAVAPAPSEMR
jgi:hypothetical protein